jgi:hypothetical protein
VALRRSVSKRPMFTPIVTAASVAAACASERPKRSRPCGGVSFSRRLEMKAAAAFPPNTTPRERAAMPSTRLSVNLEGR